MAGRGQARDSDGELAEGRRGDHRIGGLPGFPRPRTELSPRRIAANMSSFYGFLSRKPAKRSPLPRDLTTLVDDETENGQDGEDVV